MSPTFPDEPGKLDWQGAALWNAGNHAQNLLIPLEVDNSPIITGYVVLDDKDFPEGGQNTLFEYAGSSFSEGCTSLTIHHELGDPSLEDGYTITLLKLAQSIDRSQLFSRAHAIKTAFWARNIAQKLNFTEAKIDQIELASKLHDVGKVVVPKSVLTKPSPLSDQEWLIMKRHPTFGAIIMKPSSRLHSLIPFVKAHHEKYDGSGYPSGLSGEQIPVQARIIAVADTYATITDGRVYRPPGTSADAIRELKRWSGKQFDPEIISVMIDLATSGEMDDSQCKWGEIQ